MGIAYVATLPTACTLFWRLFHFLQQQQKIDFSSIRKLGTFSWENTDFLLDFVQITSPPTHTPSPQFGQLVQLFSDVEIQDLKDSLLYYILYNLKKQLKVQIIGISEEMGA